MHTNIGKTKVMVLDYRFEEDRHPRHKESRDVENVLVLQGGGSLGAFACGVFKALVKKNVRIDILAGTSIGAVNAAIIVGSKSDHPEKDLEDFWMELAESSPNIIPDVFVLDYDNKAKRYISKKISHTLMIIYLMHFKLFQFISGKNNNFFKRLNNIQIYNY